MLNKRTIARPFRLPILQLITYRQYDIHVAAVQPLCHRRNITQLGDILYRSPVQQRMPRRLQQMNTGQIAVGFNVLVAILAVVLAGDGGRGEPTQDTNVLPPSLTIWEGM